MKRVKKPARSWVPCLLGFLLLTQSVPSQSNTAQEPQSQIRRLILTDGSYESISQYVIEGARVRYFSSERNSWEELPYSLIDWAATNIYAGKSAREASERMSEAQEMAAKERGEEEAHTPLVVPGMRLPSPDGVFLLEFYQDKPELIPLAQNGADLSKNMKANILRGLINPIAGSKQTVELKGEHARIQSHVSNPAIYFAIDPGDLLSGYNSETAGEHLRIVRCGVHEGNRIVVAFDIAVYSRISQRAEYVDIRVEPISDYWVKIVPAASLDPGEYALVEFDGKGLMNQFVWDFGVNADAPPNPAIVQGDREKRAPVLLQKPRKK